MTETLESEVAAYCKKYNIRPPFLVSEAWNIRKGYEEKTQFPYTGAAGCYAIYSADDTLLYIGKASMYQNLGYRLDTYFHGVKSASPGSLKPHYKWNKSPEYLRTVKVNERFEAPSLEEFLIMKLKPCHNDLGSGRARSASPGATAPLP